MKLDIISKLLLTLLISTTFSFSSVLAEFQGTKGLADTKLKSMVEKLDSIGFSATAKNEHLENHYYNKFKEKNLDLLSFYTVTDLKSLRLLLIENPDFSAYAPFNLLAFKMPEGSVKGSDTTWYGHLATETMLDIIGEKDEVLKEKFKVMMAKLDTFLTREMKPTKNKKLTFDNPLPVKPLLKMVKKIGEIDDMEEYIEEFISKHDSLFVKNNFIIAGFLDIKFEYDDLELDFEEYDAFWVSSLCHFEFSNTIFNHGDPHAGLFAPCSVYFYIPKGSGELHVGYAKVDNWLSSTGITDANKIEYMKKISASVERIFEELGFSLEGQEVVKKASSDSVLIELYGTKGQADAELKSMVGNLGKIGFRASATNEHLENHYFNKFKEKNVDLLNFYTIFDIESLRPLLVKNPDFGAYAPFNLLAYKKLQGEEGSDHTWYGHLNTETMLKIIGEKDQKTKDDFRAMMSKVDEHLKSEMKPTSHKTLTYAQTLPKKPLLKMLKKIGEVDDIEEFVEGFVLEHDSLFVKNNFIIAGFLDIKFEYDDLELDFEEYDAYWVSSLCHFEFSNAIFNHGSPHAAAFAPCSVYFYIPAGSGELHVGYASVDNWIASTGIKDSKKIAYMREISASVERIFKELGFSVEGEEIVSKVTEEKELLISNEKSINIVLPTVPTPIKVLTNTYSNVKPVHNNRTITYSKRVPPNYLTSEERYGKGVEGVSLSHSTLMVGEVDKGRISTYLRAELISEDEAKAKLENAGFEILATVPLDKKKELLSIVFTNDTLKAMANKENKGHLGTLRLLLNKKDKKLSITNPLYLAKAFLQDDFNKEEASQILNSLVKEFSTLQNSLDKLKFQLLPKYQFMNGLPYFKDHIVVARGENLKDKLLNNKRVLYSFDLANGATLVGVKLSKRSRKFPKKIGLNNAGMLPYPLLIENSEAKILNPKYYLSLMYPQLSMEEFMTIATIPDAIVSDCRKVFR